MRVTTTPVGRECSAIDCPTVSPGTMRSVALIATDQVALPSEPGIVSDASSHSPTFHLLTQFSQLMKAPVKSQDSSEYYINSRYFAAGQYGRLHKACHGTTRATRAVKIFNRNLPCGEDASITRELLICQSLSHPSIIRLYEELDYRGHRALVMDYISGQGLDAELHMLISRAIQYPLPGVPYKRLLSYYHQVAVALNYIHSAGVVHRDIKGDNILVDSIGHITIIDFGMSQCEHVKAHDVLLTTIRGSPLYLSRTLLSIDPRYIPYTYEQLKAADVRALGVVMFEGYNRFFPYDAKNFDILRHNVRRSIRNWNKSSHYPKPQHSVTPYTRAFKEELYPLHQLNEYLINEQVTTAQATIEMLNPLL